MCRPKVVNQAGEVTQQLEVFLLAVADESDAHGLGIKGVLAIALTLSCLGCERGQNVTHQPPLGAEGDEQSC